MDKELIRYCPECGSLGEVSEKHRNCCPDGSRAVFVPQAVAEQANAGFMASIEPASAADQACNSQNEKSERQEGLSLTGATQIESDGEMYERASRDHCSPEFNAEVERDTFKTMWSIVCAERDALQAKIEEQSAETASAVRYLREMDTDEIATLQAKVVELGRENENLRTVMMAAAVEITEQWAAHCDAEGYGPCNLVRRLETGFPAQYGYDAKTLVNLEAKVAELEETICALWETQKALCNQINDRDKLIEKCEKALSSAAEWGAPMRDAPKSSRPEWFDKANSTLAAIAAHRGQS